MDSGSCFLPFLACLVFFSCICLASVPTVNFELEFSYITRSPLGTPQQVIAVNKNFPGPTLNVTTNEIVIVDVINNLNEDLLVTWSDLSASAARPNPQGSYHYGIIDITETYVLTCMPSLMINEKLRSTINGISFINPFTPIPLADKFNLVGTYKLDFPVQWLGREPRSDISIVNGIYKGFVEIVLQNNDTVMRSFHISGYSFFVVGMDFGHWSDRVRSSYNKVDGISRSTVQVYPGGWTAVLMALDNPGVWNIRAENLDKWYLGEETYIRVEDPQHPYMGSPDNILYCGALQNLQRRQVSEGGYITKKLFHLEMAAILSVGMFYL